MSPGVEGHDVVLLLARLESVVGKQADLTKRIEELFREMRDDRAAAALTYVRQDVYTEARKGDQAVVADAAADVKALDAKIAREIARVDAKSDLTETNRLRNFRMNVGIAISMATLMLSALALFLSKGLGA